METFLNTHDFIGLKCPIPVLKAKRVIRNINLNEEHTFLCDDPASPIDFGHLCANEGLKLDIVKKDNGIFMFKISKNLT